jgi:hypothetical protein
MSSNPTQGIDVCVHYVYVFCVDSGLAAGYYPYQGSNQLSVRLRNCKTEAKVHHGLVRAQIIINVIELIVIPR